VGETGASEALGDFPAKIASLGVCHIASGDRWAGAEVQISTLLKELRQRCGLRICGIFLNEGRLAEEARRAGIDVCVLDEARQSFFQILFGAARFLAGRDVQVLHSHRYKENLLAALLARRCSVPVHVSSRHGAPEPFKGWRGLKQHAVEALDCEVAAHATDRIIAVSDELRMRLIRNLPANKVVTIHNGIDQNTVFSRLSAREAKEWLGIPPECTVVGSAGRLDPIKRLDLFLAAAKQISSELPNTRFVVAGDGTDAQHLRDLAVSLGLSQKVRFVGHRDDIYDVIRAMDIVVFCSDHEGLPMALLETLYLGVPVVARLVGGIGEVIQDGTNGILVSSSAPSVLAAACLKLLYNDAERKALAGAGAAIVAKEFTAAHTAACVAQLYQYLCETR
jgi:L-malate glycosyltransferase